MKLVLIDTGIANLASVENAFRLHGVEALRLTGPSQVEGAEAIILPGVGTFGDGMAALHAGGWVPALHRAAMEKRIPLLGICLGMQLMATTSYEFGEHKGLNLISGDVRPLHPCEGERVPHIGWNRVQVHRGDGLFAEVTNHEFYFVHGYALACDQGEDVSATVPFGDQTLTAAFERDNLYGVQFHPEKSQDAGLAVLHRFLELAARPVVGTVG